MANRIVIIGGVAGGMSAATRLRRLDEFAEITVFERGPFVSFANCGLPYHLGGEIAERGKLIVQSPARLKAVFNLDVQANSEVTAIHRSNNTVTVRDVKTNATREVPYDKLLIATGASAIVPSVPGIQRPGHFHLRTIPEMDAVMAWITEKQAKTALVLGGGFIGLEVAEQLHRRGLKVTVAEKNPQVLTPLDPEMAAHVHVELKKHGITLQFSNTAVAFEDGDAKASVAVLKNGERISADVVIIGVGVRPENKLAKEAGIEIGKTGGIKVDKHLRTSDPNIWAVGDVIEVSHGVTNTPAVIPLAGPANRQGRIAADNMCGLQSKYRHTIGTAIVRVFDLAAATTGANEKLLKSLGQPYEVVHLHPNSHAGYYPGAKSIAMKLLFDPNTRRILGAQAVGEDGVDKRIDVIATAILGNMTVDDLAELELCYAPPYGSAKDPLNLAGMAAQNVVNGLVTLVQWHEIPALLASQDHVVVDVREPAERDGGIIPGSIPIPLGQLRSRLGELPTDKTLLVHCASGLRSYNACRMLTQHGFKCRNLTGSYKTWATANT